MVVVVVRFFVFVVDVVVVVVVVFFFSFFLNHSLQPKSRKTLHSSGKLRELESLST